MSLKLLAYALKNLWRRPGRTLVVAGIVGLGSGISWFMWSLEDGAVGSIVVSAARGLWGEVRVLPQEWQEHPHRLLPPRLLEKARETEGVLAVAPRLVFTGAARSARAYSPALVLGVSSEDTLVVPWQRRLQEGSFSLRPGQVLLGRKLAQALGVGLGDKVVLSCVDSLGNVSEAPFRVVGLLRLGAAPLERQLILISLRDARDLLRVEGFNSLAVRTRTLDGALKVAPRLGGESWRDYLRDILVGVKIDIASIRLMLLIFALMGFLAVSNAFLIAVGERVRELGLLRALGVEPGSLALAVMGEALLVGVLGLGFGLALWGVSFLAVSKFGLSFSGSQEIFSTIGMPPKIYPRLGELFRQNCLGVALWMLAATLLGALYPAFKASRLEPAEALRFR